VTVRRATPLGRLLPWILLLLPLPLSAQGTDTVPVSPHSDSTVVRAVELERRDVFDPSETGFIPRLANAVVVETSVCGQCRRTIGSRAI